MSATTFRTGQRSGRRRAHPRRRLPSGFAPTLDPPARAPSPPPAPPPSAEDAASRFDADALFASDKRPIILFDGVCNLCNGGVNLALDLDPPVASVSPPSSPPPAAPFSSAPDGTRTTSHPSSSSKRQTPTSNLDAVLRIATYLENPLLPAAGTLGALFPGSSATPSTTSSRITGTTYSASRTSADWAMTDSTIGSSPPGPPAPVGTVGREHQALATRSPSVCTRKRQ